MPSAIIVGILSDTHGLLRPEAVAALRGVDHILHAGDVGNPEVLEILRLIAPTTVIRGNIDLHGDCAELPATDVVDLGGTLIYLIHSIHDLDIVPAAAGVAAVISGHSHKPGFETREGILYLNPGSAGPRRFNLPVSLALLRIEQKALNPTLITLI